MQAWHRASLCKCCYSQQPSRRSACLLPPTSMTAKLGTPGIELPTLTQSPPQTSEHPHQLARGRKTPHNSLGILAPPPAPQFIKGAWGLAGLCRLVQWQRIQIVGICVFSKPTTFFCKASGLLTIQGVYTWHSAKILFLKTR